MTAHLSSFAFVLAVVAAGALFTVLSASWFRSRALARIEHAPGSPKRSDWVYIAAIWVVALVLGLAYYGIGLIPLRLSIPLTVAATLGVLGLVWPQYMHEPRFTATQRFVQRAVLIVISVMLIAIAAGHFG